MSEISKLFGARADSYADFRPGYPAGLFAWLAQQSPATERVLDIACGSVQASLPLRQHFRQVLACDSSFAQLAAIKQRNGLDLFVADAQALPLAADSLDLIVVAQALHWFANAAFFAEVQRVLKPGGLFCAWCYGLLRINPAVDAVVAELYHDTLRGYWPTGRSSVDCGYRDLQAPFPRLQVPPFSITEQWNLEHLLGYLQTWSAVQLFEQKQGQDPLAAFAPRLRAAWGDPAQSRIAQWPLHFLAGYPTEPGMRPDCKEAR